MTIDTETFRQLQESAGEEFVCELVDTFLQEGQRTLLELRGAWGLGSAEEFRRAAHSLKSNGQTFGAFELARLARDLELTGLPQPAHALDALQRSYEESASGLRELCRG